MTNMEMQVHMRITDRDKAALGRVSKAMGMTYSDWMRWVIRANDAYLSNQKNA